MFGWLKKIFGGNERKKKKGEKFTKFKSERDEDEYPGPKFKSKKKRRDKDA